VPSKATSSSFSAFFRRSSTGHRVVPPALVESGHDPAQTMKWILI
jgi:hypothetical protein